MKVDFLKLAEMELDRAFEHYQSEQTGLGFRFLKEVRRSVFRLVNYPESYQKVGLYSRRCLVHKFPYSVIYQIREEQAVILIVAIAHLHRRPDYWASRLTLID